MLTLTAPQMTVLVGGMRVLNANCGQSSHGVFTDRPGTLTNDFFVNLLDIRTEWTASGSAERVFEGRDRSTNKVTVRIRSCGQSQRSTLVATPKTNSCATS
jgi:catalase-peroxidase